MWVGWKVAGKQFLSNKAFNLLDALLGAKHTDYYITYVLFNQELFF